MYRNLPCTLSLHVTYEAFTKRLNVALPFAGCPELHVVDTVS